MYARLSLAGWSQVFENMQKKEEEKRRKKKQQRLARRDRQVALAQPQPHHGQARPVAPGRTEESPASSTVKVKALATGDFKHLFKLGR